jgi:iron(III) transport system substrate-binding protein
MKSFRVAIVSISLLAGCLSACLCACLPGCNTRSGTEIVVYCGVDEPSAAKVFEDFEKQTGLHVAVWYDIESSKSVGLAGRLEAEKAHPQADVWWGSEAFLSARLAQQGVLAPYRSPAAADIPDAFKDPDGLWTGTALRARVLAVGGGSAKPPFLITSLQDLADPRLKGKVAMARPSAGATGAHLAAIYATWGPAKAQEFLAKLHANDIALLGGNAEVADEVGKGNYQLGLTDSDAVLTAQANGGNLSLVVPDQKAVNGQPPMGTLAMPTTVALVKGSRHEEAAKKLIDFLVGRRTEQKLIDAKFAGWSVRDAAGVGIGSTTRPAGAVPIEAMKVDYRAAASVYARAQQEGTAILEGRKAVGP